MWKSVNSKLGLAVAMSLLAVACSDAPTSVPAAPQRAPSASSSNLLGLGGLVGTITNALIAPVQRNTPLSSDIVWTFTADPDGAYSTNSVAGLTIVVPAGAVSTSQTITVTALAGSEVAYSFSPHMDFAKKVVLTQKLQGTNVSFLSFPLLSGAHFPTDGVELTNGLALVNEIVPALTLPWTKTVSFGVMHFSGWLVASGYSSDE